MAEKFYWLLMFLCFSLSKLCSQTIVFNHLSTDDGLSHYTVLSLYQDELGTIWAGTPLGVNRYNGTNIQLYMDDIKKEGTLSCNNIVRITGNKKGTVYVLTKRSLEFFDMALDAVDYSVQFNDTLVVNDIFYKNGLYALVNGRDVAYCGENSSSSRVIYTSSVGISFHRIFVDDEGRIYLASFDTLYVLHPESQRLEKYLSDVYTESVYQDQDGKICVGTMNKGIIVCTKNGKLLHSVSFENGLPSNFVRAICQDESNCYWVGTDLGLSKLNKNFEVQKTFIHEEGKGGLSNSSIYDILKDQQGNIWIGTYFGGVNYFHPQNSVYTIFQASSMPSKGLSSPIIRCMQEDNRGNLWIATEGGGLTKYNPFDGTYQWFVHKETLNSISGDNIKSLYYDSVHDVLWIGTHLHGLNSLDLQTCRFSNYKITQSPKLHLTNVVSGIVPYENFLIVSEYEGIFRFYPSTGKFEKMLDITYVRTLFLDSYNILWMATTSGQLFSYDIESKKLSSHRSELQNNGLKERSIVYDISEDLDGNLWLATFGGGLKCYNRNKKQIESFNTLNSEIPSNNLLAVRVLDKNRIVFTFHSGYSIFNKVKKTFENSSKENGFPLSYVNENSLFLSSEGKIYIGSNNGMVSFSEKDTDFCTGNYRIFFDKLWVNGELVTPSKKGSILSESISFQSRIDLNYRQNTFAIGYAVPDYLHLGGENLIYKLEGAHETWHKLIPGERTLNFYNQSPGTYRLVIRNASQHEKVQEAALLIVIHPPFYKTIYAYIFYALIIIGLLLLYYRRVRQHEFMKYEQKRIEDEEMMNRSKLQFFMGISHELCTPLTIIIGELELLLLRQKFLPEIQRKLKNIYSNGLQLHDLIYELLEFRKQDAGQIKLNVYESDICEMVYESYLLHKEYAISKGINFEFKKEVDVLNVWVDRKQMYKVVNNLLSNALKYTDPLGTVILSVGKEEGGVLIKVTDTGCGMDREDLDNVFKRFYQGKKSIDKLGTGIGLSLAKNIVDLHKGKIEINSKLNVGTECIVHLKLGKEHFSQSDLANGLIQLPEVCEILEDEDHVSDSDNGKLTLLIVEDNQDLRKMLVSVFSVYYVVLSAVDGKEGWEIVQHNNVDIVVSDIIMPNMLGTELCRMIKTHLETCHIPVILLSVRTSLQNCIDGLNVGADDYITKPFSVKLLLSRCSSLIKNRQLLQQKFMGSPQIHPEVLTDNELDKDFIARLTQFIEDNIDNPQLNINVILQEMLVSRTTLFQKLKAITGQTPMEFITNIRLKKAAFLLKNRLDMSISAISDMSGFSSSKYFSRIFKEYYHIRPIDYRNGKCPSDVTLMDEVQ